MDISILLVDDHDLINNLVLHTLNVFGFKNVIKTNSGGDAIKLLYEKKFDLVILDINMPAPNGFDILEFIKTNPKFKNIKVIILTANNFDEYINNAKTLGCDDFIPKPFSPETIIKSINELFGIQAELDFDINMEE